MQSSNPPAIAIIADAHFHDLLGNYGNSGIAVDGETMFMRPFSDTVRSTRVFNESGAALRHALDGIRARGIRIVVLLGDYSDDGQKETIRSLRALLDDYSARHGMRFFAVAGNHDIFGPKGRHRSKHFLNSGGGYDLVTSNPDRLGETDADIVIVSDSMYCAGYPRGLQVLPDLGFFRPHDVLLWETPFGTSDDPAARRYTARSADGTNTASLMDASYLVEPSEGLWLLMIDANVFVPLGGVSGKDEIEFADSTDAGWNAVLVHKPFILDWMKDVADRAKALGKTLLAFSHYPALDPLDDTRQDELALLGQTSLLGRIPEADVGKALIAAGIRVHFSGHLHVNDTARRATADGVLVNVAVPSLVAFPPAYKIVRAEARQLAIETVSIGNLPLDDVIMDRYRIEAKRYRLGGDRLFAASDHGTFLSAHLGHLVGRRYLKREWPQHLVRAVRELSLYDLAGLAGLDHPLAFDDLPAVLLSLRENQDPRQKLAIAATGQGVDLAALSRIPVMSFLEDWYRVRMGSDLGLEVIERDHLASYRFVAALHAGPYARSDVDDGSVQSTFGGLLRMFEKFVTGLPSRNFVIDLDTSAIAASELS